MHNLGQRKKRRTNARYVEKNFIPLYLQFIGVEFLVEKWFVKQILINEIKLNNSKSMRIKGRSIEKNCLALAKILRGQARDQDQDLSLA